MEAVARAEKVLVVDAAGVKDDRALLPEGHMEGEGVEEAEAVAQPVPLCVSGAEMLSGALCEMRGVKEELPLTLPLRVTGESVESADKDWGTDEEAEAEAKSEAVPVLVLRVLFDAAAVGEALTLALEEMEGLPDALARSLLEGVPVLSRMEREPLALKDAQPLAERVPPCPPSPEAVLPLLAEAEAEGDSDATLVPEAAGEAEWETLTLLALEAEARALNEAEARALNEALGVGLAEGVRGALTVPEAQAVPELQEEGQALDDAAVEALA